jgi:hypothetical protein
VTLRRLTRLLELYFGENYHISAQANHACGEQREVYVRCKRKEDETSSDNAYVLHHKRKYKDANGEGSRMNNHQGGEYRITLEEKLRFTPDIIVSPRSSITSNYEDKDDEIPPGGWAEENHTQGDPTFLLHSTNGQNTTDGDSTGLRNKKIVGNEACSKRQFDFVEVMYATTDDSGKTTYAAAIGRIMGILRLSVEKKATVGERRGERAADGARDKSGFANN